MPIEDPDIFKGMDLLYGLILDYWEDNEEINPIGLLLFVFASVIYHSEWLTDWARRMPGHPFSLIP